MDTSDGARRLAELATSEIRDAFKGSQWIARRIRQGALKDPRLKDSKARIWAQSPDLVMESEEGTLFFEIKSFRSGNNSSSTALNASRASWLRRSSPSARNPRAVLILLLDEYELDSDPESKQLRLTSNLQVFARQLTAKNGYDGVLFMSTSGQSSYIGVAVRSGSYRTFEDLSQSLEYLASGIYSEEQDRKKSERVASYKASLVTGGASPSTRVNRFLLVADEWNAGKGGITSFNRELALALKRAGKEVCIYLPAADEAVTYEASLLGIDIAVPATAVPGLDGASALLVPQLRHSGKERYSPEVVVGHGRVLGPHAYYVQGLYEGRVLRVHVVHTHPELLELAKEGAGGEPRTRVADERRSLEIQLASSADVVAGVGPTLAGWISDDLAAIGAVPPVVQIRPGLRDWGDVRDPLKVPAQREFLIAGRVDDFESKGIEVAIRSVGHAALTRPSLAASVSLVLRGVPPEHAAIRDRVNAIADEYGLNVVFRPYSASPKDVETDMRKAVAVLMPSLHEGFGLSAYEAIALGTPVLISNESGLAQMLQNLRASNLITSHVLATSAKGANLVPRWSSLVGRVLDAPAEALRNAGVLSDELRRIDLWRSSTEELFSALETAQDY
ncbi:glycosyltransferase family 4 protein [Agreia sp. Leaf210]|uniref:glycosyltransferase family 4 protein n=1 Tax=Agreia sp. Leaf210 TaxID=1735682 RepID=UPI0009EBF2E0|nr:glycosyltransferase [Agreia sp. Leaf210]